MVADGYRVNMITGELEVTLPHTPENFDAEKAIMYSQDTFLQVRESKWWQTVIESI